MFPKKRLCDPLAFAICLAQVPKSFQQELSAVVAVILGPMILCELIKQDDIRHFLFPASCCSLLASTLPDLCRWEHTPTWFSTFNAPWPLLNSRRWLVLAWTRGSHSRTLGHDQWRTHDVSDFQHHHAINPCCVQAALAVARMSLDQPILEEEVRSLRAKSFSGSLYPSLVSVGSPGEPTTRTFLAIHRPSLAKARSRTLLPVGVHSKAASTFPWLHGLNGRFRSGLA